MVQYNNLKLWFKFSILLFVIVPACGQISKSPKTFCNPLNLEYRFSLTEKDVREAADPVIVLYHDMYFLFASKSGGYWVSDNLSDWKLIVPDGLPLEDYAPAVLAIGDTLYYTAFNTGSIYSCSDPLTGHWKKIADIEPYADPALFLDDNGKVYMYYGCSNEKPIYGVELDPSNGFKEIGKPAELLAADTEKHGWERPGDDNMSSNRPWIEGAWMTKHSGKYFLQYAGPGTEFTTYADGVYVSDFPLGPFEYMASNPFSFKPTGFISGGGHGCTFKDKNGNYWRVVTMVISIKHMFERRVGLFPVQFDTDTIPYVNTAFKDFPQFIPGTGVLLNSADIPAYSLVSRNGKIYASSTREGFSVQNAVDENIKTIWCAQTGNTGEWILLDLGKVKSINALQINFGEEGTKLEMSAGRNANVYGQYFVEISKDSINWIMLADKKNNQKDVPHDYIELEKPVDTRFIRLSNFKVAGDGLFCVRDMRIFGSPDNLKLTEIKNIEVLRDPIDRRNARISWQGSNNYAAYILKYGTAPGKLYNNYMVYGTSIEIHSLNKDSEYYFTVEGF